MKQMEVVFCGNSLYLCGLAASLQQQNKQFRICMMEYEPAKAIPELKMLCPDVLVVEAANKHSAMLCSLLREGSQLMIIVIYPETDAMEVFCGEQNFSAKVDKLVQVITEAGE